MPKASKEELRTQVEKLERSVATLRARSREAVRSAKQAAARIEELEAQLVVKEKPASTLPASPAGTVMRPSKRAATAPEKSPRRRRSSVERDPGDAVPPGV